MLPFALPAGPLALLCLGAHADDIEIGCSGSVLRLLREHPGSSVHWIVFSAAGERHREARDSAALLLREAGSSRVAVHDFRTGYFPSAQSELKDLFEQLKGEVAPDLIFTHFRDDRHQDHRTVSELTWQTYRSHAVLEYEIPKYDGDLGSPNLFIPMTAELRQQKLAHLLSAFPSQRGKHWFSEDTFLALMRLRGVEGAVPEGHAEAFYCRKLVLAGSGALPPSGLRR